ncbi:hypothetical protein GCM10009078_51550 [Cupriavidus gilardii]|uniref:DUF2591 domain-containing protein n=2 Tax=Cupriavidus gilardii TaxID=82541 RepID=A0A849BK07_9BURK|nr:DUF2591 domain-containing protein [Cupriavidus gilardii]NNH14053.1 DUF2591 domain-containing protein [Cupriavidus gilardii]
MKVSELEGALLDYWVARAEGIPLTEVELDRGAICRVYLPDEARRDYLGGVGDIIPGEWVYYQPSVWWHNAGPIIERERITLFACPNFSGPEWEAIVGAYDTYDGLDGDHSMYATTPLIAAMRVYIASKFGKEVPDLPDTA